MTFNRRTFLRTSGALALSAAAVGKIDAAGAASLVPLKGEARKAKIGGTLG